MNEVFENFLVVALREAHQCSERSSAQGASGRAMWHDEPRAIKLKPDFSWWDGPRCIFVGDAKYKGTNIARIENPDL
jgi:5-methylcytosine-specific restriction enzyme subunit McrC